MARSAQNPPEEPARVPVRDRLRLLILPQNAKESVQYKEFAREQIAQDDEEWRRIQETCDCVFDQYLQNYEALRLEKAVLETENADLKQQILDLNKELEEDPVTTKLRKELEEVTAEHNKMALCLACESGRAMSAIPATGALRSEWIADPEKLSDGKKDPEFEEWLLAIERKLTVNADHFPSEYGKITYILSRVKGLVYQTMYPRVRTGSKNPYQTAEEVFDHLRVVFTDPNRKKQAKREYRELTMEGKTFSKYLQQFSVLAQEAGINPDNYKDDLYKLMTSCMKFAVLNYYNNASMGFDAFVKNCHCTADALASIDKTKVRNKPQSQTASTIRSQDSGKAPKSTSTTRTAAVTTTPVEKAPQGGWAPITAEECQRCRLEGLCFYCRQKGHMTPNCPKKAMQATAPALQSLEPPPKYAKKEEPKNNQA